MTFYILYCTVLVAASLDADKTYKFVLGKNTTKTSQLGGLVSGHARASCILSP